MTHPLVLRDVGQRRFTLSICRHRESIRASTGTDRWLIANIDTVGDHLKYLFQPLGGVSVCLRFAVTRGPPRTASRVDRTDKLCRLRYTMLSKIPARVFPRSKCLVSEGTMATVVIRQTNHRFENLFFSGMAVVILVSVLVGFAPSYY